MTLSEFKTALQSLSEISFQLPNSQFVPAHFHVTEVGKISKNFIDCGGTVRHEDVINFQLWEANDYDHRLHPEKLASIIALSEKVLSIDDVPIEVEYQGTTIEKYSLSFDGKNFLLTTKHTDCLVKDACGVPNVKPKIKLAEIQGASCCSPESGCC